MPAAVWTGRNGDVTTVAADIARALETDLGLARPPAATTLAADSAAVPAGSLLPPRERFSGMPMPTHCFVYVDAPSPRPFELRASIMSGRGLIRRSLGLGHLLYAVPLTSPLRGRVALEVSGRSGASLFAGEPTITARLNADAELRNRANALTPASASPDRVHSWKVERLLAVEPHPQGAVLLVRTLHRSTPRGWTLRADAVLDLAARIETAAGQLR